MLTADLCRAETISERLPSFSVGTAGAGLQEKSTTEKLSYVLSKGNCACRYWERETEAQTFPFCMPRPFIIHGERGDLRTMPEKRIDDRSSVSEKMLDDAKQILRENLARLGLKHSSQRDTILRVFLATRDHLIDRRTAWPDQEKRRHNRIHHCLSHSQALYSMRPGHGG